MIELENPQIEPVEEAGTYAKYEAGPLQAGYGVTLGNALRRVLLSFLEGAAATSIQIRDVYQELTTIDSDDVTIEMDLTVERGVGYLAAERSEALPIGVIAVDAIFTPVRKVNYWVESMRVGQMTNYDKLTIEIETDGTITPEEALSRSADILVRQFQPFVTIGVQAVAPDRAATGVPQLPPNMLDMPIEELD